MKTLLSDAELNAMGTQSSMRALRNAAMLIVLSMIAGWLVHGTTNPGYRGFFAMVAMVLAWRATTLVFDAFERTMGKPQPRPGEVLGFVAAIPTSLLYSGFTASVFLLATMDMFRA